MSKINDSQVTDKHGEHWVIQFSQMDFLEGLKDLDISMSDLQDIPKMNAGAFYLLAWYGVRPLARARRVSRKQFFCLFPHMMTDFAEPLANAITVFFPEKEDEEGEGDDSPPALGASETS